MIFFLISLGCSSGKDTAVDCDEAPTYDNWVNGFLQSKCQSCHHSNSLNRYGAPNFVTFDNKEVTKEWLQDIERTVLVQQSMPPSGGVTDEERVLLYQWLECSID